MMSSWNQFCFTGGYIEVAVTLPGLSGVAGLWPTVWAMSNLGRAGYNASLEGMVRLPIPRGGIPHNPGPQFSTVAVHLRHMHVSASPNIPAQRRLCRTCPGEDHPGPMHDGGPFVGKPAPEIDVFEATAHNSRDAVSQSGQ